MAESLLLVGHGDGATGRLAGQLRGRFDEVAVASLRGGPAPNDVLAGMRAELIHVVPVLSCAGTVGRSLPSSSKRLRLYPPLGLAPGLADIGEASARRVMADHGLDPQDTALMVLGHGNPHDGAAEASARRLAATLSGRAIAAEVGCLFLSQAPRADCWRRFTSRTQVVALPLLFGEGHHVRTDLPALAAQGLLLAPLLGNEPGLADIVFAMVHSIDHRQGSAPPHCV